MQLSRRTFLKGLSATGAVARVGLPPLAAMFNLNGTAYAAETASGSAAIDTRFLLWFNGNGIPERYWIPRETGPDYELTPCLEPLGKVREYVHVLSGVDNVAARLDGQGNGHFSALCGSMTGTAYTGRGAAGPSIDQILAAKIGTKSRFRSLQVGVAQESHGENVHRNMTWAGYERALPPEMIPHNLFDRLFGVKDEGWVNRKKSVLDVVSADVSKLEGTLGAADRERLDQHLTSVRDLERAIASLPPDYGRNIKEPEDITDLTDYPTIAKLQSDLVIHAFASGQTRIAAYMLTKCQSLTRFPWLGHADNRHHDYTHTNAGSPQQQRIMRDICRWHVEEFAYMLEGLRAIPEGEGNLLDHTTCVMVHEHAEANPHKCNGLAVLVAGGGVKGGTHTKTHNSFGDIYLTVAEEILKTKLGKEFPTAEEKLSFLV
ncbi:MAG TPA: DUF1552 domain-containing protein [Vicinamibacterales bacterium]|nr:DUF1552 domain-containing protein [Vicinamibacterales bacterium]